MEALKQYFEDTGVTQTDFAAQITALAPDPDDTASPGLISQWVNDRRPIAPKWAVPIEIATSGRVTRQVVAPSVFLGNPSGPAST